MAVKFWLGTHQVHWLGTVDVPLFISRRRLTARKSFPTAVCRWALDSGGFTELSMFGEWRTSASVYARDIKRFEDQIGKLAWAAPQDWMCEPFMVQRTGLSVAEHQRRTVCNFIELRELNAPVIPVVQGYEMHDYLECVEMYASAGVDLSAEPLVGLGSVCRRQATEQIGVVCQLMHDAGVTNLHGFGCKAGAIRKYGHLLTSADSMAWSFGGRRNGKCNHKSKCANCLHFALEWRSKVLSASSPSLIQLPLALTGCNQ